MRRAWLIFLLAIFLNPIGLHVDGSAQPVPPPTNTCSVPPYHQWSPQEKLVWQRLCIGQIADFNQEPGYGGALDPVKAELLPINRILTSSFIATILLDNMYSSALKRTGLRIVGARFTEELDLYGVTIAYGISFYRCLFEKGADLSELHSDRDIVFVETRMIGALRMTRLRAGGLVVLESKLNELQLGGAQIAGDLQLIRSEVSKSFLNDAHILGNVYLRNGIFTEGFMADGIEVDHSVSTFESEFRRSIDLGFAKIKGNLNLSASSFRNDMNLTKVQIDGELRLGLVGSKTRWSEGSVLTLRDARIELIPKLDDAWPGRVEPDGLTYRSVASAQAFKQWFDRIDGYLPQPYTQLAGIVQAQGNDDLAREIRFAGRDRERRESSGWHQVWLTMLYASIGYGYQLERALYWVIFFVVAGTILLRLSEQSWRNGLRSWPDKIVFSVDMLLPIIKLREKDYQIDLRGPLAYYFYFHKIMGYVLASFLIAGLSGLTK